MIGPLCSSNAGMANSSPCLYSRTEATTESNNLSEALFGALGACLRLVIQKHYRTITGRL